MKAMERTEPPTCLVTGVGSGIGYETALAMAGRGARVLGIVRNESRLAEVAPSLLAAAQRAGGPEPTFEVCDLSIMREVAALAARVARATPRLDALACVAGCYTPKRVLTAEGLETQFAVNHLASFVLAKGLLPALRAAPRGRVLIVSSGSHYQGRMRWKDPQFGACYLGLRAYEQSKLANVLFARELARREPGLDVFAFDPGLVDTAMGQKGGGLSSIIWSLRRRSGVHPSVPAADLVALALEPAYSGRTGGYWLGLNKRQASARALDPESASRLWGISETLTELAIQTNV